MYTHLFAVVYLIVIIFVMDLGDAFIHILQDCLTDAGKTDQPVRTYRPQIKTKCEPSASIFRCTECHKPVFIVKSFFLVINWFLAPAIRLSQMVQL